MQPIQRHAREGLVYDLTQMIVINLHYRQSWQHCIRVFTPYSSCQWIIFLLCISHIHGLFLKLCFIILQYSIVSIHVKKMSCVFFPSAISYYEIQLYDMASLPGQYTLSADLYRLSVCLSLSLSLWPIMILFYSSLLM